jgi:hypothetical protein
LAGEKVSGKTKQFAPTDFLRRAEKLAVKYCENELMLKNIRGSLAKIEGMTYREPSTMQSIKTIDQTGMVSYLSDKKKTKEAERSHSQTASINSRMLKKSQFSQPKIEPMKRVSSGKNFRVTSNPKLQSIDQIRNLFSGVVQIKVEPNIRIITQGNEHGIKKPIRVRQNTESKSIVCSHCNHHLTMNDSHAGSRQSEVRFSIKRNPSSAKKETKKQPRHSDISSSEKASREEADLSLNSRDKIKVVKNEQKKLRRVSQEITSNTSLAQNKRVSVHNKPESQVIGKERKSNSMFPKELAKVPYEVKKPITWEEESPTEMPRLKTNSGNEIHSMMVAENQGSANNSPFISSPEHRSKFVPAAISSGDEKTNHPTPSFPKKTVDAVQNGYTQSKFGEEAQRQSLEDMKIKATSNPNIPKRESTLLDNYWQAPGDKEYRVNLHKNIYQET